MRHKEKSNPTLNFRLEDPGGPNELAELSITLIEGFVGRVTTGEGILVAFAEEADACERFGRFIRCQSAQTQKRKYGGGNS